MVREGESEWIMPWPERQPPGSRDQGWFVPVCPKLLRAFSNSCTPSARVFRPYVTRLISQCTACHHVPLITSLGACTYQPSWPLWHYSALRLLRTPLCSCKALAPL